MNETFDAEDIADDVVDWGGTMRVRVTYSGKPTFWYASRIGEEFLVYERKDDFGLRCVNEGDGACFIRENDCEVLADVTVPAALTDSIPYESATAGVRRYGLDTNGKIFMLEDDQPDSAAIFTRLKDHQEVVRDLACVLAKASRYCPVEVQDEIRSALRVAGRKP